MNKVSVIGSGFAGLTAAAFLGKNGCEVEVFEKNDTLGGRARQFSSDGFLFDMGPSWYWMPEILERFYNHFGYTTSDFYQLEQLSPSFTVHFSKEEHLDIPSSFDELCSLFENIEKGSAARLVRFMKEAEFKYHTGMNSLVYKPGLSYSEFLDTDLLKGMLRLQVFSSFSKHVRKYFKDPRLISLMEFPVLFLGARPQDTPALYSLMNYAGLKLGTFYPKGGFYKIVEAMKKIGSSHGVSFATSAAVESFEISTSGKIQGLRVNGSSLTTKAVIAAADYHHIEQELLPPEYRSYSSKYWAGRTMAPSALIFFLGVSKRIKGLKHHNLFFDEDLQVHADEIYKNPQWPSKPLFYVCCPSQTDDGVAPEGCENLFILMPLAPGIPDGEEIREHYFQLILNRLENICGDVIRKDISFKKSYCVKDFIKDYNAFKGNAYGLANTLLQTANFKPSVRSKKISNLFFAGQLTVPGPGVPPSVISGQVAAQELLKYLKLNSYEKAF